MFSKTPADSTNRLADPTAPLENAIQSTRRMVDDTLDGLTDGVQDLRQQTTPIIHRVSEQAAALASRGAAAVRDGTQQVRERAVHASESTIGYIKDEPVKSMLIAAATGAALMAMLSLLTRSRH
jgi:ElaB/YqjD/DUF883 family membrane-anchored ribosome-binding protein